MNTRAYADLLGLIEALCGSTLADQERTRVRYFVNRRAQRAYAATELWPRFLVVGEERVVSEDGLLPYEQTGLDDIGTVLRIHATQPFVSDPAGEYGEFYAAASGIQITGYDPTELSTGADMIVSGSLNPDVAGRYSPGTPEEIGGVSISIYTNTQNVQYTLYPLVSGNPATYIFWTLGVFGGLDTWSGDDGFVADAITPDLISNWTPNGDAAGTPVVTVDTIYSAYITYKAALASTYGYLDGDTVGVPEEWFEYVAHGSYADFLRNEGQQDKALVAEAEATEILQEQLEKVSRQGGARIVTRVMNHANHQSR